MSVIGAALIKVGTSGSIELDCIRAIKGKGQVVLIPTLFHVLHSIYVDWA